MTPCRPADRAALHLALTQLAEQDPLINLRQDDRRRELLVSLYGEVQKEVIGATLAGDYGIEAEFSQTSTICIERPVRDRRGSRVHRRGRQPVPGHGRPADRARPRTARGSASAWASSRAR